MDNPVVAKKHLYILLLRKHSEAELRRVFHHRAGTCAEPPGGPRIGRAWTAGPRVGFQIWTLLAADRQAEIYTNLGLELERSTLADWVGGAARTLDPLVETLRGCVLSGEKVHGDGRKRACMKVSLWRPALVGQLAETSYGCRS